MRLLKYEFYKVLSKKFLLIFVLILYTVNCYLYINEQSNKDILLPREYDNLLQEYSQLSASEALSQITEKGNELYALSIIKNLRIGKIPEEAIEEQLSPVLNLSSTSISYNELLEKYADSRYMEDNSYLDDCLASFALLNSQLKYILSYPDFIDSMAEKAENMRSVSIFNKKGTFSYRNIIKTPHDFSHLKDIQLKLGDDDTGILSATQFKFTDMSIAAIIFLLCVYIFLMEKESGLITMTKAAKNGHTPVILSKLAVLTFTITFFSFIFYGSILFIGNRLYEFGDLSRYVQSMSYFRDCSFLLTVKEFILLFIFTKIIVTVLTSFVFAAIFNIFSKPKLIYLVLTVFVGLSYICHTFIHPASYINTLKYINLFSFFDVSALYGEYSNINFFGFPISKTHASLYMFLVLIVITVSLTIYAYIKNYTFSNSILQKLLNRFSIKRKRIAGTTSLFMHEAYKVFISNKVILIFFAVLIIGYQNIDTSPLLMPKDTAVYKGYVDSLAGELTEEKEEFIQAEQKRFDNIPSELQKLRNSYKDGLIDEAFYKEELNKITLFAEKRIGFERLKKQYQYLVSLKKEKDINGSFICELSSSYIFNNRSRDLYNGLFYSFLLVLCLTNIFPMEYKNDMVRVCKSTYNGRLRLFAYKGIIGCITAVFLMVFVNMPYYINLLIRYDIKTWTAPIQSISIFKNSVLSINILYFVILDNLFRIAGCIAITALIFLISLLVKKQSVCMSVSTVILGLPLIMSLAGISSVDCYTFNSVFVLFSSFSKSSNMIGIIVYYVLVMGLLVLSAIWGANIYSGNLLESIAGFHSKHRSFCYGNGRDKRL